MQKIACLFSFKESSWVSCQKIVSNLHKSYQSCPKTQIGNFNLPHVAMTHDEIKGLTKSIIDFEPDTIVIMDHKPHPYIIFQSLSKSYEGTKKPKIIFHIFGDFTIFYHYWERLGPLLKGFTVEFLVASDRQKILIDRMLKKNKCIVCPFPVEPSEFFPDNIQRERQRKTWGVSKDDVVFIFTGRLSRQKRIKTLITTFAKEFKDDSCAHLYIYGSQDNIGDPFLGIQDIEGEYFRIFYKAYKELSIEVQNRIHFMGSVPNSELLSVYQGADVFMNLSVHNDEDFGMSVAEAQFTGLSAGITDWGGLASFYNKEIPEAVAIIPVRIGQKSKQVSLTGVRNALRSLFNNHHKNSRDAIAESARERFSVSHVSIILQKVLASESDEFGGFTELFHNAAMANLINSTDPMYLDKSLNLNNLYRGIYSAYVRND